MSSLFTAINLISLWISMTLALDLENHILSETDIEAIVDRHNTFRGWVAVGGTLQGYGDSPIGPASDINRLYWDDAVAHVASLFAATCPPEGVHSDTSDRKGSLSNAINNLHLSHNFEYRGGRKSIGENKGTETTQTPTIDNLVQFVDDWFNEVQHYQYGNQYGYGMVKEHPSNDFCDRDLQAKPKKDCGHFTQAVWANTQYVGCGFSTCNEGNSNSNSNGNGIQIVFVCNYYVGGNILTRPVYTEGEMCTACATCDGLGLCAPYGTNYRIAIIGEQAEAPGITSHHHHHAIKQLQSLQTTHETATTATNPLISKKTGRPPMSVQHTIQQQQPHKIHVHGTPPITKKTGSKRKKGTPPISPHHVIKPHATTSKSSRHIIKQQQAHATHQTAVTASNPPIIRKHAKKTKRGTPKSSQQSPRKKKPPARTLPIAPGSSKKKKRTIVPRTGGIAPSQTRGISHPQTRGIAPSQSLPNQLALAQPISIPNQKADAVYGDILFDEYDDDHLYDDIYHEYDGYNKYTEYENIYQFPAVLGGRYGPNEYHPTNALLMAGILSIFEITLLLLLFMASILSIAVIICYLNTKNNKELRMIAQHKGDNRIDIESS